MIGEIYKDKTPISSYQPTEGVLELTKQVKEDYNEGVRIINTAYVELNSRSVIEDENRGQLMFNAFVSEGSEDSNESWKWRGTGSVARNKGIAMHANLTGNFLLPLFMAQNDKDEIDRDFSEVMRDIIEWMADNSNYKSSFLQVVFGMITNPVTYLGAEYCEVYQKIKEMKEDGTYGTKEILDKVLSGFQCPIYSSSQILITNAYERNIQKQRCIIKRRYCEYSELEAKYGDHENWQYVQKGIRSIYNDEDGLFYDIKDDEHPNLVAEETYLHRREDLEICFINGIYFGHGDPDSPENRIKHRDNRDAPKYNVTPFGYSRIGEHFFYFKSQMNICSWDNMLYDAMTEVGMNRALLEAEMPIAISGTDKVDSEVIFPNAVVSFEDKDTRITPLLPPSNLGPLFQGMQMRKDSIAESSVSDTMSGQLPEASQKAYSVAQAQSNAKKIIGSVGKSLAESVMLYGDLMKDIALNNVTAPQMDEIVGKGMKLKYRTFLLDNKMVKGSKMPRKIQFDESLIGMEMSKEEKTYTELGMLEKSGYPHKKESIMRVNPELFAKFEYLCRVDVEEMFAKNAEYWQPLLLNLMAQLQQNPFIDLEGLTRKTMYAFFQSEGDDLMKKTAGMIPGIPPEMQGQQGSNVANQFNQKQISNAVTNAVQ